MKRVGIDDTLRWKEVFMRKLLAYLEKLNVAAVYAQAGIVRVARDYLS